MTCRIPHGDEGEFLRSVAIEGISALKDDEVYDVQVAKRWHCGCLIKVTVNKQDIERGISDFSITPSPPFI